MIVTNEECYILCSPVCVCARAHTCAQLGLMLCDPVDYIARLAPLSMEFPRQEYWSGLLFTSPQVMMAHNKRKEKPTWREPHWAYLR